MNKIYLTTDFVFSSNGIANQEQNNTLLPINVPDDKSFSDLNFCNLGNNSQFITPNLNNDNLNISIDDLNSPKKSNSENQNFNVNTDKNQLEGKSDINDLNEYLKNNYPFSILSNALIDEPLENYHLTTNRDYNYNEKIIEKNEFENENELTNQNSGIFYKIRKKKLKKKIKFLVLTNPKKSKKPNKSQNSIRKTKIIESKENIMNIDEFSNKIFLKKLNEKNKYKCEHPGCRKSFKTIKLKLNRHDLSDIECKKDTIMLLHMINNIKNLLKKEKRKNNTGIKQIKILYKRCIINFPHKDYAINIVGKNLIN